jgi:amino acid transporter
MGQEPMMIFTYLGTIATLGFLVSYILIVIAAPIYLHKRKELKAGHVVLSVLTFGILMIPMVGSVYPLPAFPFSLFPFLFLAWLIFSAIWYKVADKKRKNSDSKEVYYDSIVPAEEA